jgi:hypothetical protein
MSRFASDVKAFAVSLRVLDNSVETVKSSMLTV